MSDTKKGSKAPGWELWGKRPFKGWRPSKWVKQKTHRIERQKAKKDDSQ